MKDMKNGDFWDVTPCGVTSQKTPFFIVTAVKTSDLTMKDILACLTFKI
jgi:hypothetical protein